MSRESYTRHYILCDFGEECEAHEAVNSRGDFATSRSAAWAHEEAGWLLSADGDWCPEHRKAIDADATP